MVKTLPLLNAVAVVLLFGQVASAQMGIAPAPLRPGLTPTTSPYLYLSNGRFNAAVSYYQRILPEREFRNATNSNYGLIRGLERDLTVLQQREREIQQSGETPTGHRAQFQNPGNYFQSTGSYFDRSQLTGR